MAKNILITGRPGSGKSTLIQILIDHFKDRKISGIVTPEIRKQNKRYGFKIIDIASGEEAIMASVDVKSSKRVSKYQVDVDAIDRILNKLEDGLNEADIIFVDEIGKMELYSQRFKETVEGILDSNKTVISTIQLSKNPFIKNIMKRGDCRVYFLDRDNQKEVLKSIKNEVNQR